MYSTQHPHPIAVALLTVSIALGHVTFGIAQPLSDLAQHIRKPDGVLTSRLEGTLARPDAPARDGLLYLEQFTDPDLVIKIQTAGDNRPVREWLNSNGAFVIGEQGNYLVARTPRSRVSGIGAISGVVRVDLDDPGRPQVVSEGSTVHNSANWNAKGFTGDGVKIGIIDSFAGLTSFIGTELPPAARIFARCYYRTGGYAGSLPAHCAALSDSDHGTRVAETVADVSPGATFYLTNARTSADRLDAIYWMVGEGVRVINFSQMTTWEGPGDGTSPDPYSMLNLAGYAVSQGAVFVASAGNYGGKGWLGPWQDTNADGLFDYDGSTGFGLGCYLSGDVISADIRWNDMWGGAISDIDAVIVDSLNQPIASAGGGDYQFGLPGHQPLEVVDATAPYADCYTLMLYRQGGPAPSWVQVLNVSSGPLAWLIPSGIGEIVSPAESNNPGVIAVGATRWDTNTTIASYSSWGPTPDGRTKPDIVGVADTSAASGHTTGTSFSAPHVAGLAALLVQGYPADGPAQIADRLKSWALPRGTGRPNNTWGHGLAYLPSLARLTTSLAGTGAGTVTSAAAHISCGAGQSACTSTPFVGDLISLTATASAGSVFAGWSGGTCTGANPTCSFTINADTNAVATFSVVPCTYSVSPTSTALHSGAGQASFSVTAARSDCGWAATSHVPWLTVSQPSALGSGVIGVTAAANSQAATRTGTVTIAGHTVTVTQAGSVTYTRYLSEGATTSFFDTQIAILNPGHVDATATLEFLRDGHAPVTHTMAVPARTRRTFRPSTLAGFSDASFATRVISDQPLVVDRTMMWDTRGYGSHAETATAAPSTVWYLAEGATHSGFDLFYLLQNPASTATTVRVRYLRTSGPPLEKLYTLPPKSRTNIWVNVETFPGLGAALAAAEFSAVVESLDSTPIIVERAMYRSNQSQFFNAGHASMGVTTPATRWFLAEGATGDYFDLFVLIANPTSIDAVVKVTYLLGDGTTYTRNMVAQANARSGIWVDLEQFPGVPGFPLADVAVSTTVESTNGVPIIVERAMWWPGGANTWHEAHNSSGATETGVLWALAEGEIGGHHSIETYILIANTSERAGTARVTLLFEDGTSEVRTYPLAPRSRTNVAVGPDFGAVVQGKRFGALVESIGSLPAQIVVERAMYSNAAGIVWAAGTNAVATKLQ